MIYPVRHLDRLVLSIAIDVRNLRYEIPFDDHYVVAATPFYMLHRSR